MYIFITSDNAVYSVPQVLSSDCILLKIRKREDKNIPVNSYVISPQRHDPLVADIFFSNIHKYNGRRFDAIGINRPGF